MNVEVHRELDILRAEYESLPREEILKLGWKDLGVVSVAGRKFKKSIWSGRHKGDLLLVAQLERTMILPFVKKTHCLGSLIDEIGQVTHVDEDFLWKDVGHP